MIKIYYLSKKEKRRKRKEKMRNKRKGKANELWIFKQTFFQMKINQQKKKFKKDASNNSTKKEML